MIRANQLVAVLASLAFVLVPTRASARAKSYTTALQIQNTATATADNTIRLPLLMKGNSGFDTWFNVQNTSEAEAHLTVSYSDGTTTLASIGPGAMATFDQSREHHLQKVFSAVITSDQPIVATVVEENTMHLFAYNGFGSTATHPVMPLVNANNNGTVTGIQIQNVGAEATDVTVEYLPASAGDRTEEETQTIQAGAANTFALDLFMVETHTFCKGNSRYELTWWNELASSTTSSVPAGAEAYDVYGNALSEISMDGRVVALHYPKGCATGAAPFAAGCGDCVSPETCGGGGIPNVCGCTPMTCADAGKNCGTIADGCGGSLDCGTCASPAVCGGGGVPNQCSCVPLSCAAQGFDCGPATDGCGGALDCGECASPATCGGGGPNVCACTPTTCTAQGKDCAAIPDGCGGYLDCGACVGSIACGGGGVPNECGLPGTGDMQAETMFVAPNQTTLVHGFWRGNLGWVRNVPILPDGTVDWLQAGEWGGPIPINGFPLTGDMHAQSSFLLPDGAGVLQSYWRGDQGWSSMVPVLPDGSIDWSATEWKGPVLLASLPGTGEMRAQTEVVLPGGKKLLQAIWRGNEGWTREVPILDNGPIDWSHPGPWEGPITGDDLPGTGNLQAETTAILPGNELLLQGIWRGNQGWLRTVPIVDGETIDWHHPNPWEGPFSP